MNEVEYIKSQLDETERLLGLTEEALELALAALKLRRVLDGRNPTPVTEEQATANLLEEYGDVMNCVEALITPTQNAQAVASRMGKRKRWVARLKAAALEFTCPTCGNIWTAEPDDRSYLQRCPKCNTEVYWKPALTLRVCRGSSAQKPAGGPSSISGRVSSFRSGICRAGSRGW